MPEIVIAALLNRLKPSIMFVLDLMFDGLAEKGFGCGYIALRPEHDVHCLAGPIHRPVEIVPFATNLQIGLVNAPQLPRGCCETVPAPDELRRKALYPTHDRRMRQ